MMANNKSQPLTQNMKPSVENVVEQKLSISVICRICYDNDKEEELIAPCHCKGTVAFVHRTCLERWLAESNTSTCELCHVIFRTERTPKYSSGQSIWYWLKHSGSLTAATGRGVRGDIIACTVITPLAILVTYICLFSSDYYNQKKFIAIPAAKWTSVSLLIMIAIMLIGYYFWVYSVIRLHSRMWYNWWQRECVVRYIPPDTAHISNRNQHNTNVPHNTPTNVVPMNESMCEMACCEEALSREASDTESCHEVSIDIPENETDSQTDMQKETPV